MFLPWGKVFFIILLYQDSLLIYSRNLFFLHRMINYFGTKLHYVQFSLNNIKSLPFHETWTTCKSEIGCLSGFKQNIFCSSRIRKNEDMKITLVRCIHFSYLRAKPGINKSVCINGCLSASMTSVCSKTLSLLWSTKCPFHQTYSITHRR